MIDLGTGAKWQPAAAPARFAAVFVHGWEGDFLTTWQRGSLPGLIDHLAADPELRWDYFSVKHTGGAFNAASVDAIAETIRTFIADHVQGYELIALVAHSLGGLGCRQFILNEIDAKRRGDMSVGGLLMFGTPNDGTAVAKAAGSWLASFSGREMAPYSERLLTLNRDWLQHVTNGGDPARAVDERAPVLCWNVVGTADRVVPRASAQHLSLLGDVYTVPYDHRKLPKPLSEDDAPVIRARSFLQAVERRYENRLFEIALDRLTSDIRERAADSDWVRAEEHTIDIEELSAEEQARFATGAKVFRLTLTNRWSGVACSDLIRIGLRLDSVSYAPDMNVEFDLRIGKGIIGNVLDEEIRRGVRAERLRDYVAVNSIRVTHGGTSLQYDPQEPIAGEGTFLLPFRCAAFPAGAKRLDEVEVRLTSYVDLAMGWYTYFVGSTITDRLTVNFRAPFLTTCLMHTPLRERAEAPDPQQIGGRWSSSVFVEEPVAPGTRITWVWR